MRSFLKIAIPGYKPPHRKTVSKTLRLYYKNYREKLKNYLKDIPYLSCTTDLWKSRNGSYFLCLTGHFYDENFNFVSLTLGKI
jgi:hypothetical protein